MRKLLLPIVILLFVTSVAAKPRPHYRVVEDSQERQQELSQWYLGYNHQYFQDELPQDTVLSRDLHDDRFMALTTYVDGRYHIQINPRYNESRKSERIDILHESCHVLMFIENDYELDDHGPHWQACMHRLAHQGAFESLW